MTVAGLAAGLAGLVADAAGLGPAPSSESARPLVHVLLSYGFAWIALLGWGWRIARTRAPNAASATSSARASSERDAKE